MIRTTAPHPAADLFGVLAHIATGLGLGALLAGIVLMAAAQTGVFP